MSSSLPLTPAATIDSSKSAPRNRTPAWLREPLLHFALLGALLFAIDHALVSRANDPHTIVINAEIDKEAIDIFKASRDREPTHEELQALRRVWLDNEVLYREGLAMQVDKGDSSIRDRIIFKALSVVDANVKLPNIDDQGLRAWFERHRDKYDEPARYDFEEAVLAADNSEGAVRAFVQELNSGVPGDAKAGLRVFKGRPYSNLVQSYGADFPAALESIPAGKWQAVHTRDGWRAMRLDAMTAPKAADFAQVRNAVFQDWTDATAAEQRTASVRALAKKYTVKYEGVAQ